MISRQGAPARLRAAYLAGRFTLVTSEPLMDELAGVLSRPHFAVKYGVTVDEVNELLAFMRENAHIVAPTGSIRVCRDPDDDVVIETAILGGATALVSGDGDLLVDPTAVAYLREHGVEAVTVAAFLRLLDDGGGGPV